MIITGATTGGVIVAPTPGPEPVPPYVWPEQVAAASLSWQWTSYTGETWNLTDLSSPVLKLRGASGVGPVAPTHFWKDAGAALDGSTWDGVRVGNGTVFMPVLITGRDSVDFLANHRAFSRSLNPLEEGTLRVTRPDGEWREIKCRFEDDGNPPIDLDPVMSLRVTYGITWSTADPCWSGQSITQNYANSPTQPWLVPPGPPMYINPSATLATATFTNPGDVPSSPIWRVNGPFTGFTVGLGDQVVTSTSVRDATGWIEIDTRVNKRTVLDANGIDRWLDVTVADFADIPPGDDVPLTVNVAGSGPDTSVDLTFIPRYRSAWA